MDLSTGDVLLNLMSKSDNLSPVDKHHENIEKEKYFHLLNCRKFKISIYKPLVTLKIALFLWYGVSLSTATFLSVFLKHRGITVQEISFMYMIIPIVQFFGTSVLGATADKLGKSKPILIGNLIFAATTTVVMVNLPHLREMNFRSQVITLDCRQQNPHTVLSNISECGLKEEMLQSNSCKIFCSGNMSNSCFEQNPCDTLMQAEDFPMFLNSSQYLMDLCSYGVSSLISGNLSFCDVYWNSSCHLSCKVFENSEHYERPLNRGVLVVIYMVVCLFFLMSYVNCFRFFDVTVMALVKEHKADYGRERIFAMLGQFICPPLIGYIAYSNTALHQEVNYDAVLYIYTGMCLLTAIVVCKVDVRGCEPGKDMWKKTTVILRNLDILFFFVILHVLGMTWGFLIIFRSWYLDDLKMEAYQIGLTITIYNLCGLPVMFVSEWLIKRIGAPNIFVLALVGRAVGCCGYSFLKVPWPAFILELTSTLSYHLLWVAVMYYCQSISPPGLVASINAFAGSIHYTLGRVFGSLVGGTIMSKFGGRIAFRVLAAVNICSAIVYVIFRKFRARQRYKT